METKETSERKSCKLTVCCKECKFGGCTKRIKYYFDFWTSQTQLRSNRGENGECQQPLYFEADAWRAEDGLKTASSTATGATIFHREPLSRVLFLIVLKLCNWVFTRFFISFNLKVLNFWNFDNSRCFEADAWRAEDGLKTASSTATGATIFHREPLSRVLFLIVLKLCNWVFTRFFISFNLKVLNFWNFDNSRCFEADAWRAEESLKHSNWRHNISQRASE